MFYKNEALHCNFQVRHPRFVDIITSIDKCSQKQLLIFVLLRGVSTYLVLDMFRPLYRPSSGCTFSYFKANYTIYSVFCFCPQMSYTSIKSAFKIIIVVVELRT
jgi:hypothetical protein